MSLCIAVVLSSLLYELVKASCLCVTSVLHDLRVYFVSYVNGSSKAVESYRSIPVVVKVWRLHVSKVKDKG